MVDSRSVLARYPDYETTIGIEVHVQLATKSKIFCTCSNEVTDTPNVNICQICTGQPGVLPVLNKQVIEYALKAGIATNSQLNKVSEFARKHYFYPDLPKNYQITQSDKPIWQEGHLAITLEDGSTKNIRLIRIHIEEDAGKNLHAAQSNESFVNFNRAGTPLLEIVTYPDINSSYEARAYLKALHGIVTYLGICSGNMEEGAFRADTNISVRKKGEQKLGTRCELKNINSFKFISDAIEYEIERQIMVLEKGERVRQETRLWDTKEHKTVTMRSKEEAADYRYFADPDLPYVEIDDAWLESVRSSIPELPSQKFERLQKRYGLTAYEAEILVNDPEVAYYYEKAAAITKSKQLINWVLRDVMGLSKEQKVGLGQLRVTPALLAELVNMLDEGLINNRAAQEVFLEMAQSGKSAKLIVEERGLQQMDNTEELDAIIRELVAANPEQAAGYRAGKEKLFGFFVGQAMQKTKGKGNPHIIQELLKKYLS
jgi:aspartyl-tRNA(Asn)/glutamyl-tRNA(Gln) amidotransferase subunit B